MEYATHGTLEKFVKNWTRATNHIPQTVGTNINF